MSSPIVPIAIVVRTLTTQGLGAADAAQLLGLDEATVRQVADQLCCCLPGTCRGGQVLQGRTACGQLCREAA